MTMQDDQQEERQDAPTAAELTIDDMREAHERIKPYIHRTPVLTSSYLNALTGAELFFKCANFQ
jgi:threonine dehydratase